MAKNSPACSEADFIKLFKEHGAAGTARILEIAIRNVYLRRKNIEIDRGEAIPSPNSRTPQSHKLYPARVPFKVRNGIVIVGSDAHYWPEIISPAHRALVHLIGSLEGIAAVVMNGDVFDGAKISRHPPIGWAKGPSVKQEIEAVDERLTEIEKAAKKAELIWTLGNHDARFESRLAAQAPEYEGVEGFTLADKFPNWKICLSLRINENVVVKHRYKGGVHATHNNTVNAGLSIVTGHLHSLKVTPFSDYTGTRFGVDTGTLADPYGDQFDYAEDAPLNHRSGFAVLTFRDGRLLWPELVHVLDEDHVEFRGEVIRV